MITERSFLSEQNKTFISYTSKATKVAYENNYIHNKNSAEVDIAPAFGEMKKRDNKQCLLDTPRRVTVNNNKTLINM